MAAFAQILLLVLSSALFIHCQDVECADEVAVDDAAVAELELEDPQDNSTTTVSPGSSTEPSPSADTTTTASSVTPGSSEKTTLAADTTTTSSSSTSPSSTKSGNIKVVVSVKTKGDEAAPVSSEKTDEKKEKSTTLTKKPSKDLSASGEAVATGTEESKGGETKKPVSSLKPARPVKSTAGIRRPTGPRCFISCQEVNDGAGGSGMGVEEAPLVAPEHELEHALATPGLTDSALTSELPAEMDGGLYGLGASPFSPFGFGGGFGGYPPFLRRWRRAVGVAADGHVGEDGRLYFCKKVCN